MSAALVYRDATARHPGAWFVGRTDPDPTTGELRPYVFSQCPGGMHPSVYEEGSGWRGQLDTADNLYIISRRCRAAGWPE